MALIILSAVVLVMAEAAVPQGGVAVAAVLGSP